MRRPPRDSRVICVICVICVIASVETSPGELPTREPSRLPPRSGRHRNTLAHWERVPEGRVRVFRRSRSPRPKHQTNDETVLRGPHFQRHGVTALCGLDLRVTPAKSEPVVFTQVMSSTNLPPCRPQNRTPADLDDDLAACSDCAQCQASVARATSAASRNSAPRTPAP
jgi:hypothetical protein